MPFPTCCCSLRQRAVAVINVLMPLLVNVLMPLLVNLLLLSDDPLLSDVCLLDRSSGRAGNLEGGCPNRGKGVLVRGISVRHLCPSVTELTFSAPEFLLWVYIYTATCQEFTVTFPVICTAVSSAVLFCGTAEF